MVQYAESPYGRKSKLRPRFGIYVSGHGYWELSNCFSDGFIRHRIRVTVHPALVGPHALAAYDPVDDKIRLRWMPPFSVPGVMRV